MGRLSFSGLVGPLLRRVLLTWARTGIAPGYLHHAVDRWGRRSARGELECRLADGSRMWVSLQNCVQRDIYFFGAHEAPEAHLFQRLVKPGMVVFDLGANVGQYTLLAARRVGPDGSVHAFEPVPHNFTALSRHVRENGLETAVRLNQVAAWSRPDMLRLYLSERDVADNGTDYTSVFSGDAVDMIECPAVRLDDYVRDRGVQRLDVLKMDIEGAEKPALLGALEILERFRPLILLELNRALCSAAGHGPEDLLEILSGFGYRFWKVGASPSLSRPLVSSDGVTQANVLAHVGALPDDVTGGWSLHGIIRENARRRRRPPSPAREAGRGDGR